MKILLNKKLKPDFTSEGVAGIDALKENKCKIVIDTDIGGERACGGNARTGGGMELSRRSFRPHRHGIRTDRRVG